MNLVARQWGGDFLASVIKSEIVSLTNTERTQNKVVTLAESPALDRAAQAKANDMAQKGYFSHVSPDGTEPWAWISESGYNFQYAGENLAVRFVDSGDVVRAWMASPSHRANMVKPEYRNIGVGIAEGMYKGQPATFVVQYFGATFGAGELGAAAQSQNLFVRQALRVFAEPRASTLWVLGGAAVLLLLGAAFAFFHHVQIQARDLLAPAAAVALIVIALIAANTHFLDGVTTGDAAAVVYSQP